MWPFTASPEEAEQNRSRIAELLVSRAQPPDMTAANDVVVNMMPGIGDALSARDAWQAGHGAVDAYRQGDTRGAALSIAEALDGGAGALPLVPNLAGVIKAYHGSPHRFDRFSMEKIGTGEGAQAYGSGLYFAEDPSVARNYQNNVPYQHTVRDFRNALPDDAEFEDVTDLLGKGHFNESQERVIRALQADDWLGFDYPSQAITAAYRDLENYDPSPALRDAIKGSGSFYEASIDVDPGDLLDWDAPIGSQSQKVRDALKTVGFDPDSAHAKMTGADIMNLPLGKAQMSKALQRMGIPGVRYLDRASRKTKDGTRNIVLFDDNLVTIDRVE